MSLSIQFRLAALCLIIAASAQAGRVEEKFDNGKIHLEYLTNAQNQKTGFYRERWPTGRLKEQSTYRLDQLDGKRQLWDEKGQLAAEEVWADGVLIYPKSKALILQRGKQINNTPIDNGGSPTPAAFADGVHQLMIYRFLCDVPYENLALDPDKNEACAAAAKVCLALGQLTHNPDRNPGLPDDLFELAKKGAGHSNLFAGNNVPRNSINGYMNDSDPGNIDRLGHRRWCLNPHMLKTGFGVAGTYQAMWSFDGSRPAADISDWAFVAYPARGYMPRDYFHPNYAWSVTLNPAKYQTPVESDIKVEVHPVTRPVSAVADFAAEPALNLNYYHIDTAGYAIPNCIIFRPDNVTTAPGSRYWVIITGVKDKSDAPATIQYLVEFF
ncbi:MAG: hypothetical protein GC162_03635 [Planctomycetes bacterium]|nr:hypothetical protein [Planctomycetota bacterium]